MGWVTQVLSLLWHHYITSFPEHTRSLPRSPWSWLSSSGVFNLLDLPLRTVGEGQRYCWTTYKARTDPTIGNYSTQNVNSAQVEKPWSRPNFIHKCTAEIVQCVHLLHVSGNTLTWFKIQRARNGMYLKSLATHARQLPLSTLWHPQLLEVPPEFLQVHTGT